MKTFLIYFLLLIFLSGECFAQLQQGDRILFYQQEWENYMISAKDKAVLELNLDTNIDVKFYHLDVKIEIDSHYIAGSTYIQFQPTINNLNTVKLNLHSSLIVDSVTLDAVSAVAINNNIIVNLAANFNIGELVGIKVYYHGIPLLANATKGLRYSVHGNNEPLIATLSTPFLSHYWWPCKDGPQDKADSVYVDITIKDSTINGLPLIAVSNGILARVDSSSAICKTFKWRHSYPIVPYYIMAAISNFRSIEQSYTGTSSTFPLTYYVFNENYYSSLAGVSQMPSAFDVFIERFGDYPFKNEKYGMTELGYYAAIENQTNTIINNMSTSSFYTSIHELSHQWFGDMITCADWHHGWVNEGFASYAEALYVESIYGFNSYKSYMAGFEFYTGGTVYLPEDTNAFNIFQNIIYSKGAYVLHMLRGVVGDEVFNNCLSTYVSSPQFKFGHATTEDFRQVCETVSGQYLEYFFDQWIYDEYYPRYKYNFFSNPSNLSTALIIYQRQGDENGWRPVFAMPLQVRFDFADGTDTLVTVINDQVYQTYYFNFTDSVCHVAIDPDKWVLKSAYFDSSLNIGIDENINGYVINVYPNPANDLLMVNIPYGSKSSLYEIADLTGRAVLTGELASGNSSICLDALSKGVYILKIGNKNTRTFKVLKQ